MRKIVLTSLRWAGAGRLATQLITWAVTIIVIQILSPEDYGLMAIASMLVGFFAVFDDLGMSASIINRPNLTDAIVSRIFGVVVIFGILVYACMYFLAYGIAELFDDSRLILIVHILSLQVPLSSMRAIPAALLERNMDFKKKSVVEFFSTGMGSVALLGFALQGFGVWALVFGTLTVAVLQLLGFWIVTPRLIVPKFDFREIGSEIGFGGYVALDRIIFYFYAQSDRFFIGKFLGLEVLGVYAVALQLAALPITKLGAIVNVVGFSAFSKIQHNLKEVRWSLLKVARNLSLIGFGAMFGMSAVAPELIGVLLNEKWAAVATPLAVLAMIMPIRMINSTIPSMLFGLGKARIAMHNGLIAALLLVPGFAAAAYYGDLFAVCLVWLTVYPVYFLVCIKRALPVINMGLGEYLVSFRGCLVAAILMFAAVRGISNILHQAILPDWAILTIVVPAGAAIYLGIMWIWSRQRLLDFAKLVAG